MSSKIDEINNGLYNVEKMLQQKSKNIEKAQEIQKVTFSFNFLRHLVFPRLISCHRDLTQILATTLTESVTCRGSREKVACSHFFHGGNMPTPPPPPRAYGCEPAFSQVKEIKDLIVGRMI